MLRKLIIQASALAPAPAPGEIDVAALATVPVTSEFPELPVDHAFDRHRGPGGSRWVTGEPGEPSLILAFDAPQAIGLVALEVEETVTRADSDQAERGSRTCRASITSPVLR